MVIDIKESIEKQFEQVKEVLSIKDVAILCNCSKRTIYRYLVKRKIKGRKEGKEWQIMKDDLKKYMANHTAIDI